MFGFLKRIFGGGCTVLTREAIETLSPEKLCDRMLYSLPDAAEANDSQRDFVSMVMLDGEVRNGGFNQYYYNMGGERHNAEAAFRRAGATEAADLVRQANDCFDGNRERLEQLWDGTMRGFSASYKAKFFDRFDEAYYALMEKRCFYDLMAQFIRSRAEDFIRDAVSRP